MTVARPIPENDGREAWMNDAACSGMNPNLFFPEGKKGATAVFQVATAKRVCAGCRVREPCGEYALKYRIDDGVWGGMSPQDRRKIVKIRRAIDGTN